MRQVAQDQIENQLRQEYFVDVVSWVHRRQMLLEKVFLVAFEHRQLRAGVV